MNETERRLKSDFRNFLIYVWRFLGLPDPTPVQIDIANYLQTGPDREIIQAFRGIGKSWITSAFVVWLLYCDPQLKILVVSASKERSDAFSTFTKRLINEIPILNHLRPRDDQRDSNVAFDVAPCTPAHAPSVKSVGVTGQMTGSRANVIVADDIETPKNSMTQLQRDKLSELVKEFDAILNPKDDKFFGPGNGRIIYLGTPQTELSLYTELRNRGYQARVWPVRYPSPKQAEKYRGALAPWVTDNLKADPTLLRASTEPTRFPEDELAKRASSYGRSGFALQFMLDTSVSDSERYPLKLSDLIIMDCDPKKAPVHVAWAGSMDYAIQDVPTVGLAGDMYHKPMHISGDWKEYDGCVMAIDPSGRGEDELGYAVVKMCMGMLYLVDCGGMRGGYSDENLESLAYIAKRHNVNWLLIESNFGDGMFTALLRPVLGRIHDVTVEEVRHSIQKEKRIIDTLEPIFNQHRMVVNKGLIDGDFHSTEVPAYQLFHQLTRITKERGSLAHDDRLDAVAMAVAYWVEQMSKDTLKNEAENKARRIDEELQRFATHVIVRPSQSAFCDNYLSNNNALGLPD